MKENKYLPENLHSILIGLMLGDAGIYKSSMKSNSMPLGARNEFWD